ncbi:MAG: hypothetical protein NXI21_04095 [Alphaproteobacteria bacterium]|nr:hypothetical protein [Alphaproteobacteria bacterium]
MSDTPQSDTRQSATPQNASAAYRDEAPALATAGSAPEPPLPYDPFPIPPYRALEGDGWRCWRMPGGIAGAGYFTDWRAVDHPAFGLMRGAGESWMTLTPMEIESQWPHLQAASGHVLIGGLGLALMAYAVAAKPEVAAVTVVERDPAVIRLARRFAAMDDWPDAGKVRVVEADLRRRRADAPVDFLYVDIWRGYRAEPKIADMQAILKNISAPRAGYWGQEVDAVDWWVAQGKPAESFDADAFRAFCAATGLPLIGLEEPRYPALCRRAAANPNIPDQAMAEAIRAADALSP